MGTRHALRERVRNRVLGALDTLARVCEDAGAAPQALVASGLCDRRAPSAMGLRGYIRHETLELGKPRPAVP